MGFHRFLRPSKTKSHANRSHTPIDQKVLLMAGTERQRELRKRRHRSKKLDNLHKKCEKANKTEKAAIVHKLRRLSPGAEQLIQAWKLA